MNQKLKKFSRITAIVCTITAAGMLFWGIWRQSAYSKFAEGMEKNPFSTIWVPRYFELDEDGFTFAVKYPDLFSFTGNLSLSLPSDGSSPYTDALIIWPSFGSFEYGLILYDDNQQHQIPIDSYGKARSAEENEVIDAHRENVQNLFLKAKARWNLNLDFQADFAA